MNKIKDVRHNKKYVRRRKQARSAVTMCWQTTKVNEHKQGTLRQSSRKQRVYRHHQTNASIHKNMLSAHLSQARPGHHDGWQWDKHSLKYARHAVSQSVNQLDWRALADMW